MALCAFAACEKKDSATDADKTEGTTEGTTEATEGESSENTENGEPEGTDDGKLYAVRMTEYDGEGNVTAKYDFKHELAGGKVVKASMVNEAGTVIYLTEIEYDDAGNVKKESDYEGGEIYWAREYDQWGKIVKEYNYQEGELYTFSQHEYDPAGNRVRTINYHADEVPYNQYEYTYDEYGNMLTDTLYVYSGAVKEVHGSTAYEYELLSDGKPAKKLSGFTVYEYEYDEDGNMTKASTYYDGELWEVTEYDADGNILKEATYDEGALERYTVHEYATL